MQSCEDIRQNCWTPSVHTPKQYMDALRLARKGDDFVIQGWGTGKSKLAKDIARDLRERGRKVYIVAFMNKQAAKYEAEVEGKSGTCAELSTVYRRLSLRDAPVVDLEVTARVVEKPRTSPTTVCSVEL